MFQDFKQPQENFNLKKMGTASSKLIPASRSLLRKRELLQNPCKRGKLLELTLHNMKVMWGIETRSVSSMYNIVLDNREQLHLDKLTLEIGQTVRHQHGTGGAGEFGGRPGSGVDDSVGGSDSATASNGDDTGTVATVLSSGDGESSDDRKQQLLLRRYITAVDNELNNMTETIKFIRQRTHVLQILLTNYAQNIDVVLGNLKRVETKVQRIELIICMLQEMEHFYIEDTLNLIEEHLTSIHIFLVALHENIHGFLELAIGNDDYIRKRRNVLIQLRENITVLQFIVEKMLPCKYKFQF